MRASSRRMLFAACCARREGPRGGAADETDEGASLPLLLNWFADRDMSARGGPLVVGLELQAELVVGDTQIAVAAAQYRRGHDCLDFLRHHADIGLVAAVVAEAIEAEAVIEVAEKGDVVLKHHVGSPNNTRVVRRATPRTDATPGRTTQPAR